jgi:outer membrane immunogenic protein
LNKGVTNLRNIYPAAAVVFYLASVTTSAQAQVTQPYNWSGAYVGGTMGLLKGRATTDVSTSDSFPGSYFTPPDPGQIAGEAHGNISQSRLEVGGF